MSLTLQHKDSPLPGLASGLAAGLIGAVAMTAFQALLARASITSGVSGRPSTEKAADQAARLTTGHSLPRSALPVAGEAVHYLIGSLVGGAYGMAAGLVPQVTAVRGAAFGWVAATVVDETLVPAFGFGDPFWKAPLISHPYSYVSHTVFGMSTEAARKLFLPFFRDVKTGIGIVRNGEQPARLQTEGSTRWRTLGLAFLLGATAGPRTNAPLATVSWAARLGLVDVSGSPLAFLSSKAAVGVLSPMAIGELVADKLPSTPSRTEPLGVGARAVSGAISGAALAGGRSPSAALAGAAGAVAATYLGYLLRTRLSRAVGRDWPVAATEDLLAFGGAALVCLAAIAPQDQDRGA
ncbi:DUF1440 domain-containing protein [Xylophilus rhododendri]|uniref:DUF1440 domain-containing protein n=1 Tax=Xylophilus rhododendri TaxID=2697032 RepID=A0A857JDS4_9BURK|nr:DUF1440 domain-containing protein [Xylophilus rhododendri]QHJ01270.1 DUF1440 domain-containing protein [Xylophilus rhododendri]